jgi:CubicO group peptidase (beta-lactamase class C family)
MESAGYVYSSAEDMTHFMQTYFNNGYYGNTRLIKPVRPEIQGHEDGWLDAYFRWNPNATYQITGHAGGSHEYNSQMSLDTKNRTGIILLANTRLNSPNEPSATHLAEIVLLILNGLQSEAIDFK